MSNDEKLNTLESELRVVYKEHPELLFHGWHHIEFVRSKSREFAESIDANLFLVASAALVHDLNYLVEVFSTASKGAELRTHYLQKAGYLEKEIEDNLTLWKNIRDSLGDESIQKLIESI